MNLVFLVNTQAMFEIAIHHTTFLLDYIHTDVWGPTKMESHGIHTYFVKIIYDQSIRVWLLIEI